jgi:tetratricopeptide (TPR) repeat protein
MVMRGAQLIMVGAVSVAAATAFFALLWKGRGFVALDTDSPPRTQAGMFVDPAPPTAPMQGEMWQDTLRQCVGERMLSPRCALLPREALREWQETGDPRFLDLMRKALDQMQQENDDDLRVEARRVFPFLHLAQHRFADAFAAAKEALAAGLQDDPDVYQAIVDATVELGWYDEAQHALDTLVLLSPSANTFVRVANLRCLRGDHAAAASAFARAASVSPWNDRFARAWIYTQWARELLHCDRPEEAEKKAEEAVSLWPQKSGARTVLARVSWLRGDKRAATKTLAEAWATQPTFEVALLQCAIARAEGRTTAADECVQQVSALGDRNDHRFEVDPRALALLWSEWQNQPRRAHAFLSQLLRDYDDVLTWFAMAAVAEHLGLHEQAATAWQQARRLGSAPQRVRRSGQDLEIVEFAGRLVPLRLDRFDHSALRATAAKTE